LYYPPVELWYFFEHDCPVCRPTYIRVLTELEAKGLYHVRMFEVHASDGSMQMEWYRKYSREKWGGRYIVPTLKIPALNPDGSVSPIGGDVYYVWVPKKRIGMSEEELSSLQLLRKQLIASHKKYVHPNVEITSDYDMWERYGNTLRIF